MKRLKIIAFAMAVVMLQPLLLSCIAKKNNDVVSADDPWYESYRIKLRPINLILSF